MDSDSFSRGINRQIEEAQKRGAFDDLPGKGRPLKMDRNPNADPEMDMAYKLLQDNNYTLPWIDKGQQIERELEAARAALSRTWGLLSRDPADRWLQEEWLRATTIFRERIAVVNRIIRDYNLEIPNLRFERFILNADEEIAKVQAKS